jgi:hypothetical protein
MHRSPQADSQPINRSWLVAESDQSHRYGDYTQWVAEKKASAAEERKARWLAQAQAALERSIRGSR